MSGGDTVDPNLYTQQGVLDMQLRISKLVGTLASRKGIRRRLGELSRRRGERSGNPGEREQATLSVPPRAPTKQMSLARAVKGRRRGLQRDMSGTARFARAVSARARRFSSGASPADRAACAAGNRAEREGA